MDRVLLQPHPSRPLRLAVCGLAVALCSVLWADEWRFDELLTLSVTTGAVQTANGPRAQLTAVAALPREMVETWTDEVLRPPPAADERGGGRVPRGYRVRIEVLQGGQPVPDARVVPGTGPLGDWIGVYPGELRDRVVWKRRALTKVMVLRPVDQPAAQYTVAWYVNCKLARRETVTFPGRAQDVTSTTPPMGTDGVQDSGSAGGEGSSSAPVPQDGQQGITGKISRAVICRSIDSHNEPVGAAQYFPGNVTTLNLLVAHKLPKGAHAEVRVTLSRQGVRKAGHVMAVDGEGKFAIEYEPGSTGKFRSGNWTVRIEVDGQLDRELGFVIEE